METSDRNSLLKDEYVLLQNFYEDFDRRALLIKGWSVTISVGGLALGFDRGIPMIWLLAAVAGLLFWLIDAKWRTYQYANRGRIKEIEAYFRGDGPANLASLQIYSRWWTGYQKQSVRKCAVMPIVMLPHVVSILLALVLLIVHFAVIPLVTWS